MPVRLTPTKSLLISYDDESDKWVTLEGISLFMLPQYVDIEPGVTVEHIFDLIDRDQNLKRFLAEYCSCDLDAIRQIVSDRKTPPEVFIDIERDEQGRRFPIGTTPVDTVAVSPFYYVFTDEYTGLRRIEGGYTLLGKSSIHGLCATNFGVGNTVTYADIKDFSVALDTEMHVAECDDDKCDANSDDGTFALSAHVRYTLFDVLTTIVGFFGQPVFDPRYQKEIDEERELWDRLERGQSDDEPSDGQNHD